MIDIYAKDMIGIKCGELNFTVATEEIELDLLIVTVRELGFKYGALLK